MTGVAHFADAVHALVRVDADNGVVAVRPCDGATQVGDLEITGARKGVDRVFYVTESGFAW